MATVLIVDDRPTNLVIAHETLDLGGHDIIEATDGHDALALAKARHPDVVVTDVMMPGIDGFQLVRELRADPATADIPVLLYTAHFSPEEAVPLAATFGVSDVLSKAGDPLDLLDAVDTALRDHPPRAAAAVDPGPDFGEQHLYTVNAKLMEKIEALDESNARFAAMAQESPVGIVIGDRRGLATFVSPRLSDITRTGPADLLGQGWLRCLRVEHRRALHTGPDNSLDPALSDQRFREQLTHTDGHRYWLSILIRAIRDSEHRLTGFIAMIDDVSDVVEADERRRADEQEREIEVRRQAAARFDSLARLSGGVAHDFNNILGVILSYDEFAKESILEARGTLLSDGDAQAIIGDLDKIQQAGERAARLAHQLLALGGREAVTPTVVDVNAVIGELHDSLGQRVSRAGRLDPALRAVRIDRVQLAEILTNLISNAGEAMPDGGVLRLETHDCDPDPGARLHGLVAARYIHIAVTDSGEGMTAEVARQAIEPFFTTRSRGQGTGLGLATAYGVVKQAGGELVIESTVGSGTTVHLYLPATEQPATPAGKPSCPGACAGQTVLVADDEDGLRAIVARILTVAGYNVLVASNGHEALAVADSHPGVIDVLLTDVVMPAMNGGELAEALHATRAGLPVLYMSGYAAPLMTEQGLLEPGVTVLGKPFTKAELLAGLHTTLTGSRPSAVG